MMTIKRVQPGETYQQEVEGGWVRRTAEVEGLYFDQGDTGVFVEAWTLDAELALLRARR